MIGAPKHVPLVVVTRGVGSAQSVESVHYGSVAVVDEAGALLWHAGDPNALTFTRSTLKPFQALAFVEADGPRQVGFGEREIALMCASHSGEEVHAALARDMLDRVQCDEHHLRCGCHVPYIYNDVRTLPPDQTWDQTYNNCSGKHAGFLAWCRVHDAPLDGYLEERHPLQRAVRAAVAQRAGLDESALVVGIDGCSAPNYAMPLVNLARLFLQLAWPEAGGDAASALATLGNAMMAHPQLVSGTGRSDLAYMRAFDGELVSKVGAAGVQAFGVKSAGLGIAIKIADGNVDALHCAAVSVLDQLGLLDEVRRAALASYMRPQIRNHAKTVTGELRPVVMLTHA